jgi:hypothetical protein
VFQSTSFWVKQLLAMDSTCEGKDFNQWIAHERERWSLVLSKTADLLGGIYSLPEICYCTDIDEENRLAKLQWLFEVSEVGQLCRKTIGQATRVSSTWSRSS